MKEEHSKYVVVEPTPAEKRAAEVLRARDLVTECISEVERAESEMRQSGVRVANQRKRLGDALDALTKMALEQSGEEKP